MADKHANVVLNFKMSGQVEYAKTIRDINAIMNAAAAEYRTHIAAMGKDAEVTQKLAAEKKKLEIQLEAAQERTKMLRAEYEAMAKDTNTTAGQLANKYKQLQNSERAEIALAEALERVNEQLSEQAEEARKNQAELEKLEQEAESLEAQTEKLNAEFELQQAQLGENASETEKLQLKLEHLEKAHKLAGQQVENYEKQLELAKKQYGENSTEAERYETKLLEAKTAEQQLANEINKTNRELKEQQDVLKKTGDRLKDAGDKMKDVGKDFSMKVTAPIVGLGTVATKSAVDFETALAGVRKTVDATEEQFAELEQGIRELSKELPTAAIDIAAVAESAGQLGIETDNILKFTETVINLGEATNLTLDQAASEFARFANIVQMPQENFDRLGSSVVALGNNFATTESEIVEMGMRLAGVGNQVGMTEAEIMALATALSSVGIEAEAGGSALSTVLKRMQNAVSEGGETLENFAKTAGMSAQEFANAFTQDPVHALNTFIQGLSKSSEEGENLNAILADVGIKGIRESDAILRLAGASNLLADAVQLSSKAWEENTALSDEAAQRYETTASQLQMFKNQVTDLAIDIGNILIPMLLEVIDAVRPWIERFKEMDDSVQKFIVILGGIAAAIGPVLVVVGTLINSIGALAGAISTVVGWFGGWTTILVGIYKAFTILTGPIGLVIAAITALIAIGIALWKNWEPIKEFFINLWDKVKESWTKFVDWSKDILNSFIDFIKEWGIVLLGSITGPIGIAVALIIKYWEPIKKFFTETIPEVYNTFVDYVKEVPGKVMEFLSKLFVEDIPYVVGYGIGWLVTLISKGIENVITFFKEMPGKILEFLIETITSIINWSNEMRQKAIETGTQFLTNLIRFIRELPGKIAEFLRNVISNVLKWATEMKEKAIEAGSNFFNNVINLIKKLPGRVWNYLSETISKMIKFASEMKKKALETGKNVFNSIVDEIKKIPGRLKELGSDIIKGLVDGVKNSISNVTKIAKDIASNFTKGFKNAMGIRSPSRVMMAIAKNIIEGLGIGIENMTNYAVDKASFVAKEISSAVEKGIEMPTLEIGTAVRQSNLAATNGISGTTTEYNYQTLNMDGLFNGAIFNVRSENDIERIAKELNDYIRIGARSKGVIMP